MNRLFLVLFLFLGIFSCSKKDKVENKGSKTVVTNELKDTVAPKKIDIKKVIQGQSCTDFSGEMKQVITLLKSDNYEVSEYSSERDLVFEKEVEGKYTVSYSVVSH